MSELNKNNLTFALQEADRLEQMLIESGGEITNEIEQALVVSEKSIGESVDREIQKIERIEHVADLYKKKADQFAMIAKTMSLFIERREQQIKEFMLATEKETLSGQEYEYFLAKPTVSTDIVDDLLVPDKFIKVTRSPMKTEIKKALESGEEVPGARLIENRSLRTRIYRGKK
jgi:uncharacterized protein YacL (UPF0231 family)